MTSSNNGGTSAWVQIVVAVIGAVAVIIAAWIGGVRYGESRDEQRATATVAVQSTVAPLIISNTIPFNPPTSTNMSMPLPVATDIAQPVHLPLNFTVTAENGWQNTNIKLNRGDMLQVDYANGEWAVAKGGVYIYPGLISTTNSDDKIMYDCTPIPNSQVSIFSLIAKIGDGKPFAIGNQFLDKSQSNGYLFLRINDCDKFINDNSGSVVVNIDKP